MSSPRTIGRYEIIETIGGGSMGSVFKAMDPAFERVVAIKTVRWDLPSNSAKYSALKSRFYHEARILGSLSHPNIVALFDLGETIEGEPFMAMEYQAGESLEDVLEHADALEPDKTIRTLEPIAAAVDYAHTEGVVHRDLKPSNILIDHDMVKIADFGIAKLVDVDYTTGAAMLGTPSYMAPEQVMSDTHRAPADIFALGVIAFEMLSGERPFPGDSVNTILYRIAHGEPIEPRKLGQRGIDRSRWNELFSKALHKDPGARHQTAVELVEALRELCSSIAADSVGPAPREQATMTVCGPAYVAPRRHGWTTARRLTLGLLASCLVLGTVLGTLLSSAKPASTLDVATETSRPVPTAVATPDETLGELSIRSVPSGASVLLNGELHGPTPIELTELPLGSHTVRLEKPGFEAVELTTDLSVDHSRNTLSIPLNEAAADAASARQSAPEGGASDTPGPPASSSRGQVAIAASVQLVGGQIVIRNENDFDWRNVELKLAPLGNLLQISRIRSNGTYSIALTNLSRNADELRAENIRVSIWCDTPTGRSATTRLSTRSLALAF